MSPPESVLVKLGSHLQKVYGDHNPVVNAVFQADGVVYEPFLTGSADEKMFRVVRDRERWFQIVMGQKFEFDENAAESYARRLPLPQELAETLTFDLRSAKIET